VFGSQLYSSKILKLFNIFVLTANLIDPPCVITLESLVLKIPGYFRRTREILEEIKTLEL
jgi:hypothetical protein